LGHPVVTFEIAGRDGDRLRRFYADLFGWKMESTNAQGYGAIDTGGEGLTGSIHEEEHGPIEVSIHVRVPDLAEALTQAESLGGRVILPPTDIGGERRLAQIEDPEGHVIGLVQA
jgi:predicted enzyme related to lactoylglutathione lyase